MHSWLAKAGLVSAALSLALLSSEIERTGPELARYGNLCGPSFGDPCLRPVLKGGFPFAYLFDAPGVSVEGKLSFGEDVLRPAPLVIDVGVYFAVILLVLCPVNNWH
jgi:hypothetical protein